MKESNCSLDYVHSYIYLAVFVVSFVVFRLIYNAKYGGTKDEQEEKQRNMLNYYNKHKAENEEFFFGRAHV